MPIMSINDVPEGAILARPIEDSMGRILINAGEALTGQLIAVLKKRGYAEVEVRPESKSRDTEALERRVSRRFTDTVQYDSDVIKLRDEIEARFHNIPATNKYMQMVRVMAQKVLIDRLAKKKGLL